MKVLIATEKPFAPKAVEAMRKEIEGAGLKLALLEKYTSREQLEEAVATVDALIVRSDIVDSALIAKAPLLKVIVRAGAGYDNIDLAAAKERGIVVENTPGQNSRAVAELVLGMAIMASRNNYDGTTGSEISGKRVGLQAFGQVSRNVAKVLEGFGCKVSAIDPFCPAEVIEQAGVAVAASLSELYAGNDIVSIHIPATPQTVGSIGRELIESMPRNAVLINTARKEVINEAELAQALENRPDLKYFADVKSGNADELRERFGARVFFTPKKCGAQTREANMNAGIAAARQTVAYLAKGEARFQVNK